MLRKPVIAIVDDDESVCRALVRLLRTAGMDARGYSSADPFLEGVLEAEPDCALLDVHMPGFGGLALQERVRRLGSQLPIIFLSAHDTLEVREQALRGGALGFMCKPANEAALLAAIARALAHKEKADRTERQSREESDTSI
jgi:FixJ family two-component response regulator